MGEREIARTMLELIETPPAGEVATASYVPMLRRYAR
jgi:CPA2 family monovalent cation:H+ antiporter-2